MQAVLYGYNYKIVKLYVLVEGPGLNFLDGFLLDGIKQLSGVKYCEKTLHYVFTVFLNPPLLWYFPKSNFLFD